MKQYIGVLATVLCMHLGAPAGACEDWAREAASVDDPALERALQEVRADQQRQIHKHARQALAQVRSRAVTALARGAVTPDALAINAHP